MTYIYLTKRNNKVIAGVIKARHSFEALHNARIEAFQRGGDIKTLLINKLCNN